MLFRSPVDFVNWHSWRKPTTPGYYRYVTSTVRGWLKEFGYPEDTPLSIGDWGCWIATPENHAAYPDWTLDTEITSSYVANNLIAMAKGGIDGHFYDFMISGANKNANTEFCGKIGRAHV